MFEQLRPPPNPYRHLFTALAAIAIFTLAVVAFVNRTQGLNSVVNGLVAVILFTAIIIVSVLGHTAYWYRPNRDSTGFVIDGDGRAEPAGTGLYLEFWTHLPRSPGGRQLLLLENRRSYYFDAHPYELLVESPQEPPTADYAAKLYALLSDVERAKDESLSIPVTFARHGPGLPNVRLLQPAAA